MKRMSHKNKGLALVIVIIIGVILSLVGVGLLKLAEMEYSLTHKDVRKAKAFYIAEAGIANYVANAYQRNFDPIPVTTFEEGTYQVEVNLDTEGGEAPYAISTGKVGNEQKRIKVELSFLAFPYEHAIFGGNASGDSWTLDLRGTSEIIRNQRAGTEIGGIDTIYGDVYSDGDVGMYQESRVFPQSSENYDIFGDIEATGNISLNDSASISGTAYPNADTMLVPDLTAMNYAENNTHNVSQLFAEAGVSTGRLPVSNELSSILIKNPSGMSEECASTSGDDYFFEPATGIIEGTWENATTPMNVGEGRIYYIDGDVWIHSNRTFGFLVDGKATIVATGDIHVCDNIAYADKGVDGDMLGFVALGKYNNEGNLISGGNVYFGDPRYGTTYTFDGMMFAANDFLYNTSNIDRSEAEPETGFSVYGNFIGLNHVSVNRDWYTPEEGGQARPAIFESGSWVDVETGASLTSNEVNNIRHYRMIIRYDERVRDVGTQPPGLPRGPGVIFNGVTYWEELPPL